MFPNSVVIFFGVSLSHTQARGCVEKVLHIRVRVFEREREQYECSK